MLRSLARRRQTLEFTESVVSPLCIRFGTRLQHSAAASEQHEVENSRSFPRKRSKPDNSFKELEFMKIQRPRPNHRDVSSADSNRVLGRQQNGSMDKTIPEKRHPLPRRTYIARGTKYTSIGPMIEDQDDTISERLDPQKLVEVGKVDPLELAASYV